MTVTEDLFLESYREYMDSCRDTVEGQKEIKAQMATIKEVSGQLQDKGEAVLKDWNPEIALKTSDRLRYLSGAHQMLSELLCRQSDLLRKTAFAAKDLIKEMGKEEPHAS